MKKVTKFPVVWTIVLIFALTWLASELGYFTIKLPLLPVILIVMAIGMIYNRLTK